MALSIASGNTVPIARTDKHVVLAMSPARPKVSSMQAKLDHTKIDTSLYEQVSLQADQLKTEIRLNTCSLFTNVDIRCEDTDLMMIS